MKHTDLMLNDLVMYQGKILRVGCISDYDIKIDLFEDGEDTPYAEIWQEELDEVKPIPLTSEILEKNGWNDWCEHSTIARSVSVLVEDNTNLCIQEIKGQNSMFVQISHCGAGTFEFRKHLKYVHELQHALKLCGIDKEIVL